ncbi:hypothetical protein K490DRAFT_57163 [Saccharata proteae CBS 121410]|uniref:Uncharacterized protein n=1 Tax=Saccharata proteae CBS 121410 TaxID=1314787 RepID=A0A9P4LYG2_9PEZI|nr:hypothetical protein K490DRAFT_57163 [Saccharata proteae CBS 121410]
MSSTPSFSEWIWSPEHGQYYCYRYNASGLAEYQWSGANRDENNAAQAVADQSTSGYSADASSTQASNSQHTTTQNDASSMRSEHSDRSSQLSGRRGVSSPGSGQRYHEGDDILMAVEDKGQLVQVSFTVRAARPGSHGQWEYQLWHDDGTLYDGGYWFSERELI